MRQKCPAPVVIDSATYASAHDQFTRYHSHYTSTLYSTCTTHNLLCQWQPDRSVVWLAHLSLQRPLQGSSQAFTLETPHPDHATHGLSCRQQAGRPTYCTTHMLTIAICGHAVNSYPPHKTGPPGIAYQDHSRQTLIQITSGEDLYTTGVKRDRSMRQRITSVF